MKIAPIIRDPARWQSSELDRCRVVLLPWRVFNTTSWRTLGIAVETRGCFRKLVL